MRIPQKRNPRRFMAAALAAGLLWVCAGELRAQDRGQDTASAPPDSSAALQVGPQGPLSPQQVPRQAELDQRRREIIRDSLALRRGLRPLPDRVAELEATVQRQSRVRDVAQLGYLGVRELDATRREWQAIADEAQTVSSRLNRFLEALQEDLLALEAMESRWARTLEAVDSTYALILQPIEFNLLETRDLLERVRDLEAASLAGVSRVTVLRNQARTALDLIADFGQTLRGRLLDPSEPPLWALATPEGWAGVPDLATDVRGSLGGTGDLIRRFLADEASRFLVHLLLVGLLGFLIRQAARTVRELQGAEGWTQSPGLGQIPALEALGVLGDRFISSGYLLSLLFLPAIYGSAPPLLRDLVLLVALLPAFRVVLAVPIPRLRRISLALLALNVVSGVVATAFTNSPMKRLAVVLVGIGTFAFLVSARRMAREVQAEGFLYRGLNVVLGIFRWLVVVGVVGEVLGFSRLAEILINGSLLALYFILLLRILGLLLEGLAVALPHSALGQRSRALARGGDGFAEFAGRWISVALTGLWLWIVLGIFGVSQLVLDAFAGTMEVGIHLGDFDLNLGDILAFALTLWVAFQISRLFRFVFMEEVVPRADLPKGVPTAISSLGQYALVAIGLLVAFSAANIPLDRLALVVSALGVGIGFGLQGVVANFVAGLILLFERPINPGDTIEMSGLLGEVKNIGIRASVVRTFDGAEVIVPNNDLLASQVVNWTLSDQSRRLEVKVGVKYGTDPEKVLDLLREAALSHPEVLQNPEPLVLFREFGDSSLNFVVRFWVADQERFLKVWSEVTVAVDQAFKEAGVEIPFPQRDLHLRTVDGAAARTLSGIETPPPAGPVQELS